MVKTILPHYATAESADFQIRLANRVARDKTCRELVRWGRGLAKSVWCDLIIPLWLWIRGEDIYMVIVGNNEDKAILLLSDIQAEFEANQALKHYFGDQMLRGSWENGNFRTKDNRFRGKALGMGQEARGLRIQAVRPNYIVCDDLEDKDTVKNPARQDEIVYWIESSLLKTMDGPVRRYLHPNNDFAPRTIQNQLEKNTRTGTSTSSRHTTNRHTRQPGRKNTTLTTTGKWSKTELSLPTLNISTNPSSKAKYSHATSSSGQNRRASIPSKSLPDTGMSPTPEKRL